MESTESGSSSRDHGYQRHHRRTRNRRGRDGDPINVVVWLANDLSRRRLGLKAGEFVFTGSVVDIVWVQAGDQVVTSGLGLGSVDCVFR